MFEKDAQYYALDEVMHKQEWYIKHPEHSIDCDYEDIKKHWGKGAEFGYNKANEWHYVKDGDLPPLNTNVLVIHRWARTPEVGKRIEVFINSSVWVWAMCSDRYRYTSDDENVIAWKEIVLPELKESE